MTSSDPESAAFHANPAHSLGYLCRIAFRSFSRALEKLTAPHGVSAAQWRFLRVLWQEDGLTQRELSRRVVMREPTTVIALKGMEKAELIRREQSTQDRRRTHVFLTPRGKALQATLTPFVIEVNRRATQGMSPAEVALLRELLTRVSANLTSEEPGES